MYYVSLFLLRERKRERLFLSVVTEGERDYVAVQNKVQNKQFNHWPQGWHSKNTIKESYVIISYSCYFSLLTNHYTEDDGRVGKEKIGQPTDPLAFSTSSLSRLKVECVSREYAYRKYMETAELALCSISIVPVKTKCICTCELLNMSCIILVTLDRSYLLHLRVALCNININSKRYAKIKNTNLSQLWSLNSKYNTDKSREETASEREKK